MVSFHFHLSSLSLPPNKYSPRSILSICRNRPAGGHLPTGTTRRPERAKYAGGMGFMGVELREEAAAVTAAAPAWLGPLLGARFFQPCAAHPNLNGNHYCLDCAGEDDAVSCPRCLSGHRSHHVVQVRRSSYHEVIRVSALRAVADVSLVQTYANNGESVVFLNRRPLAPQHAKMSVSFAGLCLACDRGLVDQAFRFCSLACKLEGMVSDPNLTFILDRKRKRDEPESEETGEEDDDNMPLPEATNLQTPRWISYRRRARKGVPIRAPFK